MILKLQATLQSLCTVDAGNVALGTLCVFDHLQVGIGQFHILHATTGTLGQSHGMPGVLPGEVDGKQRLVALVVVPGLQPVGVGRVRSGKHDLDELVQFLDPEARLLGQDVTFGEGGDHVGDKGVADDLEEGRLAWLLARKVDVLSPHDALAVRLDSVHGLHLAGKHTDQLPGVRHGRGAKDGARDEAGAPCLDHVRLFARGFRVNRATVDEDLACHVVLEDGVDHVQHGRVIPQAVEDDVRLGDDVRYGF